MADPLSIAGAIVTFGELAMTIKESIDKVGDNKEILANLEKEVSDTVKELKSLAQGFGDEEPTGELLTALQTLTEQLEVISSRCQALAQSKGVSGFVKAWFKRDKIEAEINKLKDHRKYCCDQFQLFSLARVERHTALTEEHAAQIKVTTARTEETAARTEAKADQLISLARKEELQRWFQAIDMREKQRATYALRHNDTGSWVLKDTKFARWKEEPGYLWIRGNSGTGKSVLSSIAIDHLFDYRLVKVANSHPATPSFGIAYFYFDFRDENKQLPENMLRSIIMQLSEQSPEPYSVLDQQFKSCQGGKFPTFDNLLAMLDTILSQFTGTYVILDALDECSEHDELVQFISNLRGWGKPVHLLVASQPRTVFVDSTAFEGASVVVLEPHTTHADILQYVDSELELNSKLKHIKKVKDAAPKIVDKSNGMFRMAACLLQELTRKRVDTNIDKILAKLPNDLFGIYTRFLQSIDEDDFVYVAALLRWVTFSVEPVTLCQLDEALAINFSEPDQWVFEPENRGRVDVVCGLLEGLVTVLPASQHQAQLSLAHSSVNDYIVSEKFLEQYKEDLKEAHSHTFLAQSCVTYLLHFENNPLNADTLPQYPLAQYAAQFWSHHLLRCHDRGVLRCSTMRLLEHRSKQYVAMNCLYNICEPWNDTDWSRHAPWPLYLCSLIGYVEGVEILLEKDADVNAVGGEYGSALQGAASKGHLDIVCILLEHGANVNTLSVGYDSALQGAASRGHMDIVHLLLKNGADVNAVGGDYGSALQAASAEGRMDIVCILLEHGAEVNAAGRVYGSALQGAAREGRVDIVRVLLQKGADVNAAGGRYGSALQGAASSRHVDIVRILLEKGANVDEAGGRYGSALQVAASRGHMDIVHLLLKNGADVNAAGGMYGSALQCTAREGRVDIVRVLLQKGADVNTAGGRYGSALQGAASAGHMDIVRLLLKKGADVNATGGRYGSALQGAAWNGHLDIVRLFLEKGADVNTAGGKYSSALQGAALYGHMHIICILLEKGADVNATGGRYGSALQCAASAGHMDIVHLLLEKGAHVNAAGGDSGSALQDAAVKGKVDIVRVLLENSADINAVGGYFGSALQAAAVSGNVDIVRILLEHGADVNATGGKYGSALGAASAKGHEEIASLLRERGALEAESGDPE
ncbi:ankyrin repeat-containing domain protein [Mycena polygramma]|nr:ankyrin repeat-containing domain protein [Mycena polygramma]